MYKKTTGPSTKSFVATVPPETTHVSIPETNAFKGQTKVTLGGMKVAWTHFTVHWETGLQFIYLNLFFYSLVLTRGLVMFQQQLRKKQLS